MIQELIGREVEVKTFETIYRGVLVEVGEVEIHLQLETGWMVIPVDKVIEITEAG